jgi:hypothetical protein
MTVSQCGICGKVFPSALLVAGHIMKRSECTSVEKIDIANVAMAFCVFGCDALFERRYIKVVERNIHVVLTGIPVIDEYLDELKGVEAPGWSAGREQYFAWHANQPLMKFHA